MCRVRAVSWSMVKSLRSNLRESRTPIRRKLELDEMHGKVAISDTRCIGAESQRIRGYGSFRERGEERAGEAIRRFARSRRRSLTASNAYPVKNHSDWIKPKRSTCRSSFHEYCAATSLFAERESRCIRHDIRGSLIPIALRDPSRSSASQ